jgi:hypothetical protein
VPDATEATVRSRHASTAPRVGSELDDEAAVVLRPKDRRQTVFLEAGMDIMSYITPQIVVLALAVLALLVITLVLVALAVREDS